MKKTPISAPELDIDALRAQLRAVREQIDAALVLLGGAADVPTPLSEPEAEPRYMKLTHYRASRDLPESTLRSYLAEGMPSRGAGRSRRILVVEADAWLEARRGR